MRSVYQDEKGQTTINGHVMTYVFKRSKAESAFGIRGSRIFELHMKKDGLLTAEYEHGWKQKISNEDEESALCLSYIIDRYGKQKKKEKE